MIAVAANLVSPKAHGIFMIAAGKSLSTTDFLSPCTFTMMSFARRIFRRNGKKAERLTIGPFADTDTDRPTEEEHVETPTKMAQTNGISIQREQTPVDTNVVPPGRVISTSMMRQGMS